VSEWHDTDTFWEGFQEVMFSRRRWDLASDEVEGVVRLTSVEPNAHFLDLCCGPGRHALALAGRGFRVTGVDRTPSYIEAARANLSAAVGRHEFLVADARTYRVPGAFDAAICLYTSFGYFESKDEDLQLLQNVCDSLTREGSFVLDVNGKEVLQRVFSETSTEDLDNGATLTEERTVGPEWAWVENRWIVRSDTAEKETTFRVRMYSGSELSQALRSTGFSDVKLYGDWTGSPYDDQARRLIAVARK
jgi:SAM-dependent methyltransferase